MRNAEFGTGNGEGEMADDKWRMADDKWRMAVPGTWQFGDTILNFSESGMVSPELPNALLFPLSEFLNLLLLCRKVVAKIFSSSLSAVVAGRPDSLTSPNMLKQIGAQPKEGQAV